jgi:hypothetical protein
MDILLQYIPVFLSDERTAPLVSNEHDELDIGSRVGPKHVLLPVQPTRDTTAFLPFLVSESGTNELM